MTVTTPLAPGQVPVRIASLPATPRHPVIVRTPRLPAEAGAAPAPGISTDPPSRSSARWHSRLEHVAMVVGAAAAVWFLAVQTRDVEVRELLAETQARWAALAALVVAASFVGAAMNLMGFSAVRLSLVPTVLVQVAGGFVKVVSPSAVGCAILNARYLRRSGATRAEVVTSIGAAQTVQFLVTIAFLGGLATFAGTPVEMPEAAWTILGVAVSAVLLAAPVIWLCRHDPRLCRVTGGVRGQLRALYEHAVNRPGRVVLGVSGSVVLVMSFALGLAISVRAFGGPVSLLTITLVFLAGSAAGSLVPSPGGLGTVEAALVTGLVATGQAPEVALPAVMWFRLVSVWAPVPLGWAAVHVLRRREFL
jgi:uncharacterized membrane protein YbhN (UPF0104 family)